MTLSLSPKVLKSAQRDMTSLTGSKNLGGNARGITCSFRETCHDEWSKRLIRVLPCGYHVTNRESKHPQFKTMLANPRMSLLERPLLIAARTDGEELDTQVFAGETLKLHHEAAWWTCCKV